MRETKVAEEAITWLTHQGWDCYSEVEIPRAGVCDIVAVRQDETWIVETKVSLTSTLASQCLRRLHGRATGVVACAPTELDHFWKDWMAWKGIGYLWIRKYHGSQMTSPTLSLEPRPCPNPLDLTSHLHPEQKRMAKAGSTGQPRWTPWKGLQASLLTELQDNMLLTDTGKLPSITAFKPRLTEQARSRSVLFYLKKQLLPGWQLSKVNGRLRVVRDSTSQNGSVLP